MDEAIACTIKEDGYNKFLSCKMNPSLVQLKKMDIISLSSVNNIFCDGGKNNKNNSSHFNEWFQQYWTGLRNYLNTTGYLDKAYYYFANEPQDQDDYDAVAWYSRYLKQYASDLKLMVSEEPKPEIYNDSDYVYPHQIDIWTAHLGLFLNLVIAGERLKNHGEETWIYFLKSTFLPHFNAITLDHPGIEGKLTGWFLWKYRLRGLAYYQFNNWSSNPWTSLNPNGQNGERFLMYPPTEDNSDLPSYGSNGHRFVPSIVLSNPPDPPLRKGGTAVTA